MTEECVDLSFITQELVDQVQLCTPELKTTEQVIQYALTHTILTTHLPYDIQTSQTMALSMSSGHKRKPQLRILKRAE